MNLLFFITLRSHSLCNKESDAYEGFYSMELVITYLTHAHTYTPQKFAVILSPWTYDSVSHLDHFPCVMKKATLMMST